MRLCVSIYSQRLGIVKINRSDKGMIRHVQSTALWKVIDRSRLELRRVLTLLTTQSVLQMSFQLAFRMTAEIEKNSYTKSVEIYKKNKSNWMATIKYLSSKKLSVWLTNAGIIIDMDPSKALFTWNSNRSRNRGKRRLQWIPTNDCPQSTMM